MFRARDSCGADVRRGRSPKCLFIKATATGSTINGLNDEINKLPEGGGRLGMAWPGCHRWAEPQACLQARSLPGLGRPACPPRPCPAPQTPPPHACPCLSPTLGHAAHEALARPPSRGHFWAPHPSWPPQCITIVPDWEVFGFRFWWSLLGFGGFCCCLFVCLLLAFRPDTGCLAEGRAPWKWQRQALPPHTPPPRTVCPIPSFRKAVFSLGD